MAVEVFDRRENPAPPESGGEKLPQELDSVPLVEGMAPFWPDEAVESSFRAEARERGEPVVVAAPKEEAVEATDATPLPALGELVARVPAEVRDALEDLFRAKFVAVKRVPKKSLKG